MGTQVAKGQAAGSSVPSAAREPPRALAACHLGVYDRQFRVDGYDFVFLQISGSRIRLARGAGCQPQLGTQVAKGQAAGLCVSFVANTVCNMALCCCTAAFTAYIRFRVDSHYFSFWPQKFSPARGSVPTTVRRASGQGRVSVHYVSCAAKEPSRVPTTCWHGVYDRQFRLARRFSKFNSFSAFVPGTVLESHVYGRHDCIDSTRSSQP